MKKYTKKQKKNFFRWQIRLFGNLLIFCFFVSLFLLEECKAALGYSENIFTFHVTLAWASLLLYAFVLNYYFLFKNKPIGSILLSVYVNMATILSGICWGKLSFGFFLFYDSKIFTYFSLLIFLISLYLISAKSLFFCIIGYFLLFQERLSTYFLNSVHQVFVLDAFSDSGFITKKISLGKSFILMLNLLIFCLAI